MSRKPKHTISENSALMAEWDFEKNDPLGFDPAKIGLNSHHKVWWRCEEGHSWNAMVSNRSRHNRGCPYCSHQLPIKGETDLATCFPELAKQWHPTKNSLKPDEVMPGTHKKAWWICEDGHEWEAQIKSRTTGVGCPVCANKKVRPGYNDLATVDPDLAAEWHPTKNGKLTPADFTVGSGERVWWICQNKHEWQAAIDARRAGRGCPKCLRAMRTSFPEQAVYYYVKQEFPDAISGYRAPFLNAMELDIYIPSLKVGIEYDGKQYHAGKDHLLRDYKKHEICKENGILLIRIMEWHPGAESPLMTYDRKLVMYDTSDKSLNWAINNLLYHLGRIVIPDVRRDRKKILELLGKRKTNLATAFPEIAAEWDYEKNDPLVPESFAPHSNERVYWKCSNCNHKWAAAIGDRTREDSNGCPRCADKRGAAKRIQGLIAKRGSLASEYPELLGEWNYRLNVDVSPEDLTPSSSKKVWWICDKGHEWKASVGHRTHGRGCPVCCSKKIIQGVNDLATLRPNLMTEWDYEKNSEAGLDPTKLAVKSGKKAFWRCSACEHEWRAVIATRSDGRGCPRCAGKMRKTTKQFVEEMRVKRPLVIVTGEYVNCKTPIAIQCAQCGTEWSAKPSTLLIGQSLCPKCRGR